LSVSVPSIAQVHVSYIGLYVEMHKYHIEAGCVNHAVHSVTATANPLHSSADGMCVFPRGVLTF
jgi:hypothetical protein